MIDKVLVSISVVNILKLNHIEDLMIKEGMAEQDINFIISKLCDIYLREKKHA